MADETLDPSLMDTMDPALEENLGPGSTSAHPDEPAEVAKRVSKLEARVAALEADHANSPNPLADPPKRHKGRDKGAA
jgi:hypothetical protein